MPRLNSKGVALTLSIVIIIILALLATFVTTLGYNQRKLSDALGGRRAKVYYRAQAGVVEAGWRIRENYTTGLNPGGSFATDTYDPFPYSIDVDGDGANDCVIDIGAAIPASKQRVIASTGLDI